MFTFSQIQNVNIYTQIQFGFQLELSWIQIEVNGCVFAGEKVGSVAGKEIFSEGTRWHYQSQLRPSPPL